MSYNLVVLGSGPGGYVAALRAAQYGMTTALIDDKELGGICLNWGCIPTKSLLHSGELYHRSTNPIANLSSMVDNSRAVVAQLGSGIRSLLQKNNVQFIAGRGSLMGDRMLLVINEDQEEIIEGDHIIIATGARPRILPQLPIDHNLILDYKDAIMLRELPETLLIVGAGAIGVEFASFYNSLGVNVTLIEIADRILISEDKEVSTFVHKSMERAGIKIFVGTNVLSCLGNSDQVEVKLEGLGSKYFSKVISAVGVVPNVEEIGLENTKIVQHKSGYIETDDYMRTAEEAIYAIGDVTAPPLLAHKASHQAFICVDKIAGRPYVQGYCKDVIPGCIYGKPQVASIGHTEESAVKAQKKIKIGRFSFAGNGKAVAMGCAEGFIKLIFDSSTEELLGAHLVGESVTEIISVLALAKSAECTKNELLNTVFPHPTISEVIKEAAADSDGEAIHM